MRQFKNADDLKPKGKLRPITVQDLDQGILNSISKNVEFIEYMGYIHDRWEDEKEFEDWEDYQTAIHNTIQGLNLGLHFVCALSFEKICFRVGGKTGNPYRMEFNITPKQTEMTIHTM